MQSAIIGPYSHCYLYSSKFYSYQRMLYFFLHDWLSYIWWPVFGLLPLFGNSAKKKKRLMRGGE